MTEVKSGDKVQVHYHGSLTSGEVFDSSRERDPLEVQVGAGQVIPGFDNALMGMKVGDTKTVTLSVDEAYGPRNDQLINQVPREQFPVDPSPQVGMQLLASTPDGQQFPITITEIQDDVITVDANPPLAGKELVFDLELVAIL